MTIYVDEVFTMTPRTKEAQRFGNRWCHMWTDSEDIEELHRFAEQLFKPVHPRIVRRWFQGPPDHAPHYDITEKKRFRAIQLGAREMTSAERLRRERAKGANQASLTETIKEWVESANQFLNPDEEEQDA